MAANFISECTGCRFEYLLISLLVDSFEVRLEDEFELTPGDIVLIIVLHFAMLS